MLEVTPAGRSPVKITRDRSMQLCPGRIDGHPVLCNSLDTQLRAHLGYQPDDDHADMRALGRRFGCRLPAPYGQP